MIISAKLTSDSNWVDLVLDDGRGSQVSVTDGVNRRHTAEYTAWLEAGNTPEPFESEQVFKSQFSSNDYLARFTQAEQVAIATETLSNIQVKLYYDKLLAADYIDLNDPRTEEGLDALIALDLLDAERKPILLKPEPVED
jgi:hypothetical protein